MKENLPFTQVKMEPRLKKMERDQQRKEVKNKKNNSETYRLLGKDGAMPKENKPKSAKRKKNE